MYFAKIYEGQLGDDMQIIYSSFDLKIPFPKYYVLYNGERKIPERMELKLSDMYIKKEGKVCDLECIAHIININYGNNKKLLNACKTLNDYAKLISEIRNRRKDGKTTYESIDEAIDYCIEHNILKEFLHKHKCEVVGMFLTEFDQKKYNRVVGRLYEKRGEQHGEQRGENKTLFSLVQDGIITKQEALKRTNDKKGFEELFKIK